MQLDSKEKELKSSLLVRVPSRYHLVPNLAGKENLRSSSSGAVNQLKKHAEFGKIPEYLSRMAEEKKQKGEEEAERVRKSKMPEGCRHMSEEEKEKAISDLQSSRREVLDQMKNLPLRIETLGQRRRKLELELKLGEIEKTLEKLSEKIVYIRVA